MRKILMDRGFIYLLCFFVLIFIAITQSGCEDDDPFADACPEKELEFILDFSNTSYNIRNINNCPNIPTLLADPCDEDNTVNVPAGLEPGNTSILNTLLGDEYYCTFEIQSDCPFFPRTRAWDNDDEANCSKKLSVPDNEPAVVTVRFVENCDQCNTSPNCLYSREIFEAEVVLDGTEPTSDPIILELSYVDSDCSNRVDCK